MARGCQRSAGYRQRIQGPHPATSRRPADALRREVVMNRSVFAPALTLLVCSVLVTSASGQAKPAAPTTPAPPVKAGFATPIKGEAAIQVLPGTSKYDPKAKEVITT